MAKLAVAAGLLVAAGAVFYNAPGLPFVPLGAYQYFAGIGGTVLISAAVPLALQGFIEKVVRG